MKKLDQGILIALEGIDGSGKTTLSKDLSAALKEHGYSVVMTREPGGTELGKKIREFVQHSTSKPEPKSEFLLFAADRAHHIDTLVRPALQECKVVISDRMSDSSLAYQGYGRGLDISMIETVNAWAMAGVKPDITIYVKVDLDTALKRMGQRALLSTFEKEKREFFEQVMRGFEVIFHNRSDVIRVDGTARPEVVVDQVLAGLMPLLAQIER